MEQNSRSTAENREQQQLAQQQQTYQQTTNWCAVLYGQQQQIVHGGGQVVHNTRAEQLYEYFNKIPQQQQDLILQKFVLSTKKNIV